jgi:hypothetical protein
MENVRVDFTTEEVECMLYLIDKEFKEVDLDNLYEFLEDKFNINTSKAVINYLMSYGVIEKTNENNVFIYNKRLRDVIDEQLIVNKVYNYLSGWHFAHW